MSFELVKAVTEEHFDSMAEKMVLIAIASFTNAATGRCDPSMAAIAERSCMTERGARAVIRRLEAIGKLVVETGGGRFGCSWYRINPERASGFIEENPERGSAPPRNAEAQNPEADCTKPGTTFRQTKKNKEEEQREGDSPLTPHAANQAKREGEGAQPAAEIVLEADAAPAAGAGALVQSGSAREGMDGELINPRSFEAFWTIYPKKTARAAAKQAFDKAVSGGVDPACIVRGAAVYARTIKARLEKGESEEEVYRYTKVAKNWLVEERWNDAPPPVAPASAPVRPERPMIDKSALAAFAAKQAAAAW